MVIKMSTLKFLKDQITQAINVPLSINFYPNVIPPKHKWKPILLNCFNFKKSDLSPSSALMRGIAYSQEFDDYLINSYLILIDGDSPLFVIFDTRKFEPIIFYSSDADQVKHNSDYLRLLSTGLIHLIDISDITFDIEAVIPKEEVLRCYFPEEPIDEYTRDLLYSGIKQLSKLIKYNGSDSIIKKPVIL